MTRRKIVLDSAEEEMHALRCNDTWDLVPLPQGHKGIRMDFQIKI